MQKVNRKSSSVSCVMHFPSICLFLPLHSLSIMYTLYVYWCNSDGMRKKKRRLPQSLAYHMSNSFATFNIFLPNYFYSTYLHAKVCIDLLKMQYDSLDISMLASILNDLRKTPVLLFVL